MAKGRFVKKQKNKKKTLARMDMTLLVIIIFLIAFGLIMIYSASSYESMLKFEDPAYYFKHQLRATVLAIMIMITVIFIDYHLWKVLAIPGYIVAMISVALVWSPLGVEVNGARRWLNIFGQSLQPAEIAKIAVVISCATFVVAVGKKAVNTRKGAIYLLALGAVMAYEVYKLTSNLSSAIIIFAISFAILFVSVPGYKWFALAAVVGGAFTALFVYAVAYSPLANSSSSSFRLARIKAWVDPEAYASGKGFQTLQALYSIGSGGIFGKGLGQSMQKMGSLPEAQNDMIFSIICEELGLFGAIAVLMLFVILIWRCMIIAQNAPDLFGSLLVIGIMVHIAVQVILNVAVVTNTIPNTGITLPFISYGGTSIIFLLIEMGMVLNVSRGIVLE